MKVLCAGNLNYDILLPVDRMPDHHEKMDCQDAVLGFGGSAANTAYWLARLGCRVAVAGAVGDDAPGREHLASLTSVGVDTAGVDTVDITSGTAVVLSIGRDKRMIRAAGANRAGRFHEEVLEGCGVVFLSGANGPLLVQYAQAARKRGIMVFCGSGCLGEESILKQADGFLINSDELEGLTGLHDLEDGIMALDAQSAAVTLPTGGCLVSERIHLAKVEAPSVEPVDRTGAGDAFAAGYLAAYGRGESPEVRGRWGNLLAREVLMGRGARPEIEIPEELRSW